MDPKTLETVEELILGALADTGRFKVVGRSDLGAVMGFEKQRQALGCEQSAACLAEIAGALGVDYIGVPNVGRLGTGIVVSLKLIEARTAAVHVRARRTVASENELEAAIVGLAREVAQAAGAEPGSPPLPPSRFGQEQERPKREGGDRSADATVGGTALPPRVSRSEERAERNERGVGGRAGPWLALGLGLAAAGAGAYFGREAYSAAGRMQTAADWTVRARADADAGRQSTFANVSFGVAAASVATAAVLWWLDGRPAAQPAVAGEAGK